MKVKEELSLAKVVKKYFSSLVNCIIFGNVITVLSNLIKGVKILEIADIVAIVLSSIILVGIKFIYHIFFI